MFTRSKLSQTAQNKLLEIADCYFYNLKTKIDSSFVTLKLYRSDNFSDIKIIVEETTFNLHKAILGASCPFFEQLFDSKTADTFTLGETSKKSFEKVLEYIYTSNCDLNGLKEVEVADLLKLAGKYLFKEFLATLLIDDKTPFSSICDFISSIYENCPEKRSKCLKFFDSVSENLVKETDTILKFSASLIQDVFSRFTFVADEINLFNLLKSWFEFNGKNNLEVFSCLHLGDINPKDFLEIIKPTMLIETETYLKALAEGTQPLYISKTRHHLYYYEEEYSLIKRRKLNDNSESDCDSYKISKETSNNMNLYQCPKFSDVTIVVEDTEFKLHRAILYTSCNLFKTLLENPENLQKSKINIEKVTKINFEKIIEFIYTNDSNIEDLSEDGVLDLISFLSETKFNKMISHILSKEIVHKDSSIEYVLKIFDYCNERIQKTNNTYHRYFGNFAKKIIKNQAFTKISKRSLINILSRDSFYMAEIQIFKAVHKWILANGDSSSEVLDIVRLGEINVSDYLAIVKPTGIFQEDIYLNVLVAIGNKSNDHSPDGYSPYLGSSIIPDYHNMTEKKRYTTRYNIMESQLRYNYFPKQISKANLMPIITKLHKSEKWTDVIFIVENCEIKLHKAVMAASSSYFENMLLENMKELKMVKITLKETNKKSFEHVIEYIYNSKSNITNLNEKEVLELIDISREYLLHHFIKNILTQVNFKSNSSFEFVVSIGDFAEEYNDIETKNKCFEFLGKNAEKLVQDFENFSKITEKLLKELLSKSYFDAKEIDIFNALKIWFQSNGKKNSDIFSSLRLNLITITEYLKVIQPTGLIDLETYLKGLCNANNIITYRNRHKSYIIETGCHENGFNRLEPGKLLRCMTYKIQLEKKVTSITFDIKIGEYISFYHQYNWMNRDNHVQIGSNIFNVQNTTSESKNIFPAYITYSLGTGYYACKTDIPHCIITSFRIIPAGYELIGRIFNVNFTFDD